MEDSLVVEEGMLVKFTFCPFCHLSPSPAAPAKGSFHQEEVNQPLCRNTQRPKIMKYLEPPFHACQNSAITVHWCLHSTEFRPEQQALSNSRERKVDQKLLQEQFLCTSGRWCMHLIIFF